MSPFHPQAEFPSSSNFQPLLDWGNLAGLSDPVKDRSRGRSRLDDDQQMEDQPFLLQFGAVQMVYGWIWRVKLGTVCISSHFVLGTSNFFWWSLTILTGVEINSEFGFARTRRSGEFNGSESSELYPERSLINVNRRSLLLRGDVGVFEYELLGESLALAEEFDRCLFSASARMSSRLTFRSEEIIAMEVSRCSVNLEAVMINDGGWTDILVVW
jgi:hypothetical protein